jgi:hypothetical protein
MPAFKTRDQVWLNRTNIATERPSRKLNVRKLGLFRIGEIVRENKQTFRLELSLQMRIHLVFHSSLLEPYKGNIIEDRNQPPLMLKIIDNEEEYEVEEVLDSKITYRKLYYLISWKEYSESERS